MSHGRMYSRLQQTDTITLIPFLKDMEGKEARWLQWHLNKFGYNLKEDSIYGPKTLEAVKDFQKKHDLVVDGLVGRMTKAALKA